MKSKILLFLAIYIVMGIIWAIAPSISKLDFMEFLLPVLCSAGIISLGSLVFVVKANPKNIINRFLTATTVQMLAIMFFLLILVKVSKGNFFALGIFTICTFMAGVLTQSGYLIYNVNRKDLSD